MSYVTECQSIRRRYAQMKKPTGASKFERPIEDFNKKWLKSVDSAVKALDSAVKKRDAKSLAKLESGFNKLVLEMRTGRHKAVAGLRQLEMSNTRREVLGGFLEHLVGAVDDLRPKVAADRHEVGLTGPQPATDLIPPRVFEMMSDDLVAGNQNSREFIKSLDYELSILDESPLPDAAREHQNAERLYREYTQTLARVSALRST